MRVLHLDEHEAHRVHRALIGMEQLSKAMEDVGFGNRDEFRFGPSALKIIEDAIAEAGMSRDPESVKAVSA